MKRIALILAGVVSLGVLRGVADDDQKVNPYTVVLSRVARPELPAKAAVLVRKAKAGDQRLSTVSVVEAALQANPASAYAVVSAISGAVSEMAPVAAGTAAALQPNHAVAIAKAAAAAAPAKATQIVLAVSRAVPKSYRDVAVAVSDLVPGSGRAILAALSSAFPELKAGIDTALANDSGQSPSVGLALSQAGVVTLVSPGAARGPAEGPPYVPLGTAAPYQANNDPQVPTPVCCGEYAKP